jgi:hypothetical protein
MDEAVRRFRRQVSRELGARRGAERRYSLALRHAALAYWRQRERAGEACTPSRRRWGWPP